MEVRSSYFLISVSTRENLELCIKYALAGFPSSRNGFWTFSEINEGDFISFLFGAKAYNLYRVKGKIAVKNADKLPPWKPIVRRTYKKTYNFPFRLVLEPIREFQESLVRTEFSYVAENLLLRGGYMKTHFQADQTTLQNVSEMGKLYNSRVSNLAIKYDDFEPHISFDKSGDFRLNELLLQSAIRQNISDEGNLKEFLRKLDIVGLNCQTLEVLGEKALPQGHVDILIKEAVPIGMSKKIVLEVKLNKASNEDLEQVKSYMDELGKECVTGVLISKDFQKKIVSVAKDYGVKLVKYSLTRLVGKGKFAFVDLKKSLEFEII